MYLSIDFEDFNHDLKRSLGIWETGPLNKDLLWEKYFLINNFYKNCKSKKGRFGTFFVLGLSHQRNHLLLKGYLMMAMK